MKYILLYTVLITGCATASPVDFLVPTRQLPATQEFLGKASPPKAFLYHSLADTKIEKAMLKARLEIYKGQYELARVGNEVVVTMADPLSNLAWGAILLLLTSLGIAVPKPGTAAKITEAGNMKPEDFNRK